VAIKIVTTILALCLSKTLEDNNIIVKEQAGFHPREEAIVQFITFTEIIQQRHIVG
jgi:hypothetical protein